MIVPERLMRGGKVCPSFQIDEELSGDLLRYRWCANPKGYIYRIKTSGGVRTTVLLHREVIRIATGRWPSQVDHINRDKRDNRLCNLREVTAKENCQNRDNSYIKKKPGTGSRTKQSGLPVGVFKTRSSKKYQVIVCGKYLGTFPSVQSAEAAYVQALKERVG
jgi:hypothetical protein